MHKPQYALSIRQPWAHLIVSGEKDIENRPWHTGYRGRIYVHAGKTPDGLFSEIPRHITSEQFGAIVGEVDVIDCVASSESRWFEGPWGWVLANPVAYPVPIPCRGQLGLWIPKLDPGSVGP
ncbi:MAG: ASCH domain-containing protein [Dehalococcoidia bacterium]